MHAISIGETGANDPILIPPQLFMQELLKIRSIVLPQDLDLPIEINRSTLTSYYQLATPQVRIIQNQLIICFTIPLVTKENFMLFKITSVPKNIYGNFYNFIIPKYEFVALDKFKKHFVSLSNNELDNCHHVNDKGLICKQIIPVMTTYNTRNCEIKLLKNDDDLGDCDIRIANITNEIWIKLRQPNAWIYTIPQEDTIHISCNNEVIDLKVNGTGKLIISARCEVNTKHILIKGFHISKTDVYKNLIPSVKFDLNMSQIVNNFLKVQKFNLKNMSHPNIINPGQAKNLEDISMGLAEIHKLQDELETRLL